MKSSVAEAPFAEIVGRALALIRAEVPWVHETMERAIGPWTVRIVVDDEPATVGIAPTGSIEVGGDARPSHVTCTTTSQAILGLVDGRETALDAIEADRIALFGDARAILAWHEVLELFLHGAVRARGFDALLDDFRRRPSGR